MANVTSRPMHAVLPVHAVRATEAGAAILTLGRGVLHVIVYPDEWPETWPPCPGDVVTVTVPVVLGVTRLEVADADA